MGYEALGMIAGVMTTFSFAPQAYTVYRTKSTQDISLVMYIVLCTGVFLWVIYGVMIDALSVWLWNGITLIFASAILGMKVYWEHIQKPQIHVKVVDAQTQPDNASHEEHSDSPNLGPSKVIEMTSDQELASDTEKPSDSDSN